MRHGCVDVSGERQYVFHMADEPIPLLKLPYSQQFSPQQTPLPKLLGLLRSTAGKPKLAKGIGTAFFSDTKTPEKLATNTLIALRSYGILGEGDNLTAFGNELLEPRDMTAAAQLLAKRVLIHLNGIAVVQTLRDMAKAGMNISLQTIPTELRHRGFDASESSSDLSGVLGWLREGGVLTGKYGVDVEKYESLVGSSSTTLDALSDLSAEQICFLRAMFALNVRDWTPYNGITKHAEALYAGMMRFNQKEIKEEVLIPLQKKGFIEVRKKEKIDIKTPEGRGAKQLMSNQLRNLRRRSPHLC